jgi:hypothetical protein
MGRQKLTMDTILEKIRYFYEVKVPDSTEDAELKTQ